MSSEARGGGDGDGVRMRRFVRSFVRSFARRVSAVDANARVDASRRACRPRVSFRDDAARETREDDGWMDGWMTDGDDFDVRALLCYR
jgi:hypothetical protein|tara:strand:+ start:920 stop:1183 length:264 start_codon:yes stop_codon:yes gene_type:complete